MLLHRCLSHSTAHYSYLDTKMKRALSYAAARPAASAGSGTAMSSARAALARNDPQAALDLFDVEFMARPSFDALMGRSCAHAALGLWAQSFVDAERAGQFCGGDPLLAGQSLRQQLRAGIGMRLSFVVDQLVPHVQQSQILDAASALDSAAVLAEVEAKRKTFDEDVIAYGGHKVPLGRIVVPLPPRDLPGGPRDPAVVIPKVTALISKSHPVAVRHTVDRGFGLFATRDIAQGEVVLVDEALYCVHGDWKTRCHHCTLPVGVHAPAVRCTEHASCTRVFCSAECCQRALSEYHAAFCGAPFIHSVDDAVSKGTSSSRLFHLIAIKLCGACVQSGKMRADDPQWADMQPINLPRISHLYCEGHGTMDERTKSNDCGMIFKYREMAEHLYDNWKNWLLSPSGISFASFVLAHRCIQLNAMQIGNASLLQCGCGLLPVGSFFNHHCTPNLGYCTADGAPRVIFSALRGVRAGEELTISYASDSKDGHRAAYLGGVYGIKCGCALCCPKKK